jgi:expansin (peptidoglycan-binding protein)
MTFYDLGGSTPACHFPPNGLPQYYGAMNEQDYAASAVCGACVEIRNTENNSTLTVQIVDECPCEEPNLEWCCNAQANHHIDVNQASYSALGANNNPPISWRYVPCSTSGNIRYYFDPAAKEGYLAVTIMNHRYRIKRVTANGQQLTRRDYNVWESTSHGPGPFTFQVTDIYDRTITDSNVPLSAGQMVQSSAQFATCQ